jgi:DNA mismatch repair protein MutS
VPDDYRRRQTLKNAERFITPELKAFEDKALSAQERALAREKFLFEQLLDQLQAFVPTLTRLARALAALDALCALAERAQTLGWCAPEFVEHPCIEILQGRHPVVQARLAELSSGNFIANDTLLGPRQRMQIITGPNMGGKSTYMRQVALIVLLAQAGGFVPAQSATIGLVDRLFSRVGAGDDLARGRSTFMAEMVETAAILTQATPRSLVILDEIGRGTATYDGLAIAWACAEALHEVNRCRGLFATHYHELAVLEGRLAHVSNLSLKAKEWNGDLIFLHEAGPGPADRSYGVQVAKLAGVPPAVVVRAREVLERLEREAGAPAHLDDLPLFAATAPTPVTQGPSAAELALRSLDPDSMSPREAMVALYRLKGLL